MIIVVNRNLIDIFLKFVKKTLKIDELGFDDYDLIL